ncbi:MULTISPECIES: hypothetical protein [unclassified Sporosarcina]|uniref:hypothetical protein n=1 Tax=unclassified Sporosarcina TaxID=2647733 RepID=UPI000C16D6C0|nr:MULTISPECIES: hypothetical protein [unclassified Sporosarcina]PID03272.1 hypothetical protein CSV67_04535 [Sporosarcina sp. P2]PID26166.1 hypothetical protein CSV60_01915 [Sporosarcina sp. P7]
MRVAELFNQDSLKRKPLDEKVRVVEFFDFDWLTGSKKDRRFIESGTLLGIDVTLYHQVVVLEMLDLLEQFSVKEMGTFASLPIMESELFLLGVIEIFFLNLRLIHGRINL